MITKKFMSIRLSNLKELYNEERSEILKSIDTVLKSGNLILSKENLLLPRTFCYFDDLFLADYCLDDSNGEPLAISEFNKEFKDLKLGKFFDHINDFKFPLAKGQIYTLHDLNNVDYEKYIGIYNSESLSGKKKDKFRSLLDD